MLSAASAAFVWNSLVRPATPISDLDRILEEQQKTLDGGEYRFLNRYTSVQIKRHEDIPEFYDPIAPVRQKALRHAVDTIAWRV